MSHLRQDLVNIVGVENVSSGESVRKHHGQDHGPHPCAPPDLVTWPQSVDQVSRICQVCLDGNIPVIPYSTGTGLEGGVCATFGGVCVNLSSMTDILQCDTQVTTTLGLLKTIPVRQIWLLWVDLSHNPLC